MSTTRTIVLYEADKGRHHFRVMAKFPLSEQPTFPWIVVERLLGIDALGVSTWGKESVPHIVQELTMGAFVMILDSVGMVINAMASSEQPKSAVEDNPIDNVYPDKPAAVETAWLIERHVRQGDNSIKKLYWYGFDSWRGQEGKGSAIRLSREEDANRIVQHLDDRQVGVGVFKAVRHEFLPPVVR